MITLQQRSNIRQVAQQWTQYSKKLNKRMGDIPKRVANEGARLAVALAPKDTGMLVQSIAWKSTIPKKEAIIMVRPLQNPKYRGMKGLTTRYAIIQHSSPRQSPWQAKTGDPHFMITVRDLINDRFKGLIRSTLEGLAKK